LLRIVISALALGSALQASVAVAQDQKQDNDVVDYAPGSTGRITAPLATIVDDAKRRGEALRAELEPLAPAENAFGDVDFDALREQALNNPRVRSLLGAGEGSDTTTGDDRQRYEGSRVFLLASFSMPKESLRQMMQEAQSYGVPIVFRGFVNNSVYDTQAALEDSFGTVDDAVGFSIDPTLFTRFDVTAVPQVIAVRADLDVCETQGCEADPMPPHDRVKGNVPLDFALRLIAENGDVAAAEVRRMLGD